MNKAKKHFLLIAIGLLCTINLSFYSHNETESRISGTFKGGIVNGESIVELTINTNKTFKFKDNSVATKPILVEGIYSIKDNKVKLQNNGEEISFHKTWKLDNNGNCLKSRKGITYYRICK